jgi:hypothetical protein
VTTIVRAWDEFRDLANVEYDRGVMRWGRGASGDDPTEPGVELRPHESVGWVSCGAGSSGVAMGIGVDSFGVVKRLLVADGEEVRPGQPLMEFESRPPTTDEYWTQWERRYEAEQRVQELRNMLSNPFRAFWSSLTRRHWRR